MTASLLLSRVLGILRDTAMSAKFGIGHDTDPYRLAFAVPDTLFFLIAGGALSSAFIPIFSSFLHTEREDEAWELFNVVVTLMSIIVTALIVVLWIFAPQLSAYFADGRDPAIFPEITRMTRDHPARAVRVQHWRAALRHALRPSTLCTARPCSQHL